MAFYPITEDNYSDLAYIYLEGIKTSNATFETQIPNYEDWNNKYHPFARIAIYNEDKMMGWAALSPTSKRSVYRGVAEVSIYVSHPAQGQGVGTRLLNQLIKESEENNIWTLQCGIMKENEASIYLHKKCGFREIGYREKVAQLNGIWRDNILMERRSTIV